MSARIFRHDKPPVRGYAVRRKPNWSLSTTVITEKVKTSKGFTLAELLIVMAIITLLAAVAVPTFAKQLETARETNDVEVIRNAYTDAYTTALQDIAADGKLDTAAVEVTTDVKFIQSIAGFDYITAKIAGAALPAGVVATAANKTDTLTFTFTQSTTDGSLSLTTIEYTPA